MQLADMSMVWRWAGGEILVALGCRAVVFAVLGGPVHVLNEG